MSDQEQGRARKRRRVSRWIFVPFVVLPLLLALFLTGLSMDASFKRQLQAMRKVPLIDTGGQPSPWDRALGIAAEAFHLPPDQEAKFFKSFDGADTRVQQVAYWLERFDTSFSIFSRMFPSDPAVRPQGLSGKKPLLNRLHSPSKATNTARRVVILAHLEGLLRRPAAIDHFLSLIRFALVAGRGEAGHLRLEGGRVTNLILFTAYVQMTDLLKRHCVHPDDVQRLVSALEAFEAVRLSDCDLLRAECHFLSTYLDCLKAKSRTSWSLPRLAFIGDPIIQLAAYRDEACALVAKRPPVEAASELKRLYARWQSEMTVSAAALDLIPKFADRFVGSMRVRSLGAGCRVVAYAEMFRLRTGQYPRELAELLRAGMKVPDDPITLAPFVYRRRDSDFILYSCGFDGRDDGGDSDKDLVITNTVALLTRGQTRGR